MDSDKIKAVNLFDRYNRHLDTLRISLTDRCNLSCVYCTPKEKIELSSRIDVLTFEEILKLGRIFIELGVKNFKLTGGEPLVRKGTVDLIKEFQKLPGLSDLSLTTNGVLLPVYLDRLKKTGLKRINISLDTLQKEKYKLINGSDDFDNVFEGLTMAIEKGFSPVKINVVLLNGVNSDEIQDFIRLTQRKNLIVRFIEFMPAFNNMDWNKYFVSGRRVLEKAEEIGEIEPYNVFKGFGPAEYYRIKGYKGGFGLITAVSNPFCYKCNRLRLTSTGQLLLCLHNNLSFNLRDLLRNAGENEIKQFILHAVLDKPEGHHLKLPDSSSKEYFIQSSVSMCYIGG